MNESILFNFVGLEQARNVTFLQSKGPSVEPTHWRTDMCLDSIEMVVLFRINPATVIPREGCSSH